MKIIISFTLTPRNIFSSYNCHSRLLLRHLQGPPSFWIFFVRFIPSSFNYTTLDKLLKYLRYIERFIRYLGKFYWVCDFGISFFSKEISCGTTHFATIFWIWKIVTEYVVSQLIWKWQNELWNNVFRNCYEIRCSATHLKVQK